MIQITITLSKQEQLVEKEAISKAASKGMVLQVAVTGHCLLFIQRSTELSPERPPDACFYPTGATSPRFRFDQTLWLLVGRSQRTLTAVRPQDGNVSQSSRP